MDYAYFCKNLGNLMGLPVRAYRQDRLVHSVSSIDLQPDIIRLVEDQAAACQDTAAFFEAHYLFFAQIKDLDSGMRIAIGPAFSIRPNQDKIMTLLRSLDLSREHLPTLRLYLDSIPTYPIESFLQIICFVNYFINREKVQAADLIARNMPEGIEDDPAEVLSQEIDEDNSIHNTYAVEKEIQADITAGRPDLLNILFGEPPAGRVGKIAHDELRQKKNTFICAATLASRAAIVGGLPQESAFKLSDRYIQQVETLYDYNAITRLNIEMLLAFARRVESLRVGESQSSYVTEAVRYISGHLDRRITLDEISARLGISRTYLCELFKSETGETLNHFITRQKITEAQRLLKVSEESIAQISARLGFSSQSYFQNVFRKVCGITPDRFRRENRLK